MRRLLLALLMSLPGCPPNQQPPEPTADPARDPGWWRGTWVVDTDRLADQARVDGLSEAAQQVAAALIREAAPRYSYELAPGGIRRLTPKGELILPARVRVLGPDTVEFDANEVRLRLIRDPGGPILRDGGQEMPVKRATQG